MARISKMDADNSAYLTFNSSRRLQPAAVEEDEGERAGIHASARG